MNIKQDVDCLPLSHSHFHSSSLFLSHSFPHAVSFQLCVWQHLWLYCCLSGVRVLRFCKRRSLAGQRVWHTQAHTHIDTHPHWPDNSYRGEAGEQVLPAMNLYKLNSWSFWDVRSQRHRDSFDTCGHTHTHTHTHSHTHAHLWLWVDVDFLLFARLLSLNAANGSENCRATNRSQQQQINWTQIKMLLTQFVKATTATATATSSSPVHTRSGTGFGCHSPAQPRPPSVFVVCPSK